MSDEDRAVQAAARRFVDGELIPHEVEAEMNGGELQAEIVEGQRRSLEDLGLRAINMPKELGGAGLTSFQQVLVQEQSGRATNALGWVIDTGPAWAVVGCRCALVPEQDAQLSYYTEQCKDEIGAMSHG